MNTILIHLLGFLWATDLSPGLPTIARILAVFVQIFCSVFMFRFVLLDILPFIFFLSTAFLSRMCISLRRLRG